MLYSILVAIDVLLAIAIVGLVLIQQGKGADAGAAFGSGSSGTVFGAQGSASFLTKLTTVLAIAFFVISLWLAHLASNRPVAESVIDTDAVEETVNGKSLSDVPGADDTSEGVMNSDVPEVEQQMNQSDSLESSDDMPVEPEQEQTDAAIEESLDSVQDSMESIKEEVESTLENVTPDDVPE